MSRLRRDGTFRMENLEALDAKRRNEICDRQPPGLRICARFHACSTTSPARAPGYVFSGVCRPDGAWPGLEARLLAEWILADRLPVRLGLQLHKFIWDPATARASEAAMPNPPQASDRKLPRRTKPWCCSAAAWTPASPRPSHARLTKSLRARQLRPAHRAPRAPGVRRHRGFLWRARAAGGAARPFRADWRLGADRFAHRRAGKRAGRGDGRAKFRPPTCRFATLIFFPWR